MEVKICRKEVYQHEVDVSLGGMVVESIGSRSTDCKEALAPCSKVLLFKTDFTNNSATVSGSAILATTPYNVLVACTTLIKHASSVFISQHILSMIKSKRVKKIDPNNTCPSWQGNSLPFDAPGDVIGTFGQHLVLTTSSENGPQIAGNYASGFVLPNVKSAKQFSKIIVKTIDAFGNTPAPVLFEKDALQLTSSDKFLKDNITFPFVNMSCVISSISASAPQGNYTIDIITKDEDVLEPTTLTISISACGINEELTGDQSSCQECRNGSYNFNSSKVNGCTLCPKHATCDGLFVVIEDGYWQRSPCHDKLKKCIVEKACKYPNRTQYIDQFSQDDTDCDFNETKLEEYEEIQCNKVRF